MPERALRVALYLNQFFGQVGGEEAAGIGPRLVETTVGPGRALVSLLQPHGAELAGTVVCGDNSFAEQPERATAEILELVRALAPDLFLAGPAYNAGRYGVACGALCRAVGDALSIPSVTGMFAENPGVDLYREHALIVETGETARTMAQDLERMVQLAMRLEAHEPLGHPRDEGYFSRGMLVAEIAERSAAQRAIDMLLAKVGGAPYASEVELPTFTSLPAAQPVRDLRRATVALVTDGGLVPLGNPDAIESRAASKFGVYSIEGLDRLDAADYEVSHGGYDTGFVKADPHRLVPLDVAREMEAAGTIGRLYQNFLSTTGLANPIANSRRIGREMAEHLKADGVDAVILTST